MFNEALPPLTPAEIAIEFAKMAEDFGEKFGKAMATPDFDSLRPGRPRDKRKKGFKIDLKGGKGNEFAGIEMEEEEEPPEPTDYRSRRKK